MVEGSGLNEEAIGGRGWRGEGGCRQEGGGILSDMSQVEVCG
jgi:hypothetical protein